jgi:hypothetical protein
VIDSHSIFFSEFCSSCSIGPVTNLLVIPMPSISTFNTEKSLAPEIPTLEKVVKPIKQTAIMLQSFGSSNDGGAMHACFESSSLFKKLLLDLEVKTNLWYIEKIMKLFVVGSECCHSTVALGKQNS